MANGQAFSVTGAVARTLGSANTPANQDDTGADKGYPMFQGRLAWTFPLINDLGATVGASGHFGEEEYDANTAPYDDKTANTWSTCLDVTLPVSEILSFKGELYRGSNLSQMLGGIGYGVNSSTEEVHNYGGWVAASLNPADAWSYNSGYGFSKNHKGDLAANARLKNSSVFANAIYDFNKHASAGIEVSRWVTEYNANSTGRDWRAQLSLILKN
jgi:hypothetical protein